MTDKILDDIKTKCKSRTPKEKKQLLVDAKILLEDGTYHPNYFTKETVESSKRKQHD